MRALLGRQRLSPRDRQLVLELRWVVWRIPYTVEGTPVKPAPALCAM